jgi:hypothetical protein
MALLNVKISSLGISWGPGSRTGPTRYTLPRLFAIESTAMITVAW